MDVSKVKPGDLIGTNKDSYIILEMLPAEYDSRVKAMEVDEKPSENFEDVGGADKQIQVRGACACLSYLGCVVCAAYAMWCGRGLTGTNPHWLCARSQELVEAVVIPMKHPDAYKNIGIRAPKGVLLHGKNAH